MKIRLFLFIAGLSLFVSCTDSSSSNNELPILGNRDIVDGDTVFHKISDFKFINQDSNVITNSTFANKIYVADVFFTSCPSICPKVKQQMLRLYDKFEEEEDLLFLSHSIDVIHDSVPKLKAYADKLELSSDRCHFVTGEEDELYRLADEYFIAAVKDKDAPGGFDHSGRLILVDANRHVRAFAEGTDPESVTKFMDDIQLLLNEHQQKL